MFRSLLFALLLFLVALPLSAQDTSGIKAANLKGADVALMDDHDPEVERAHFDLLPGYEVNLFAAEPMLANPVHMVWDSRGRLWVACSWAYPQIRPGEVADDKIIILEDTDGDGRADKSTVFADGLYLPTGIELANGGCYVAQSPDVFFLKDTDGDDVADEKQLALTGFGIEDNHHSISAWRRGPGGWLYFQEGIFLHTQVETQYGLVRNFNGGVYQFNPRTQELRVFVTGTGGNPWGHVFDRWGQSFMVNNPKILYLTPASGNSSEPLRLPHLISTEKQCGGEIATGTHVGDDIRGQLLTGRFKSRAVVRYEFLDKGAGFSARVLQPLISSRHPNFRPVDTKIGPDGAVYVADWYNSIINHAQHDFRDPRRDHDHGRIWRITRTGAPLVKAPVLHGATISELVPHLASAEDWVRHQCRNELAEKDPDEVLAALEAWVDTLGPDQEHALVEAMWACQNVERPSEKILCSVLAATDGNARSAGARVLRYWHAHLEDPIALLAAAAGDPHPRTRMEALLSAGFIPLAKALPAALRALDHETDSFLDAVLPQTVEILAKYWAPALEAGELEFADPSHRAYAERFGGVGFERRFRDFLAARNPSSEEIRTMAAQFTAGANAAQVGQAVRALVDGKRRSPDTTHALLEAIEAVGRRKHDGSWRTVVTLWKLLESEDDETAAGAARALGAWKAQRTSKNLVAVLGDTDRISTVRTAAAVALAEFGDTKSVQTLRKLASDENLATRYSALVGLARADMETAAPAIASALREDPGEADPVALVSAVLRWRKGPSVLLGALGEEPLHPVVSEQLNEFHRRTGQLPSKLASLLQIEDKATSLSAALLRENQAALVADVEKLGDPARGELLYRRPALACTGCHAIGPVGPAIGPNLVAVGGAATTEYMIESILKPNAAIAEHYENVVLSLTDGTVRTGVITFESEAEVTIRDVAQGEVTIPAARIQRKQSLPSLMPAGLADQLGSRQEFLDLARFLSVLGRPGPFANDESPVIRRWTIATATGDAPPEDLAGTTAYALVSGELPMADLGEAPAFARGAFEVLVAGQVALEINDSSGLRLWIEGKKISDPGAPIVLAQGRHELTVRLDPKARTKGLRVELAAPEGSAAKFQPEGGL